jgi:hypothetical protein
MLDAKVKLIESEEELERWSSTTKDYQLTPSMRAGTTAIAAATIRALWAERDALRKERDQWRTRHDIINGYGA